MNRKLLSVPLCTALLGAPAFAQGPPQPTASAAATRPAWGIQDASIVSVSAWDFEPLDHAQPWGFTTGLYRYRTGGSATNLVAGVSLSSGAMVTGMELEACDTSASAAAFLALVQCPAGSDSSLACTTPGVLNTGASATPGCGLFFLDLSSLNITIDNLGNSYMLSAAVAAADSSTSFRSARLYYKLQVSTAPATATFSDVPTSDAAFQFIEAFAAAGITVGCTQPPIPPAYCPDDFVTRRQMAVFFAKALGLHWPN